MLNLLPLLQSSHRLLMEGKEDPGISEAYQYLVSRGLTDEDLTKYLIGYKNHHPPIESQDSDLAPFLEMTGDLRLLNRKILFPILNTVGFADGILARSLPSYTGSGKRYRNFPLKSSEDCGLIFGLHQALPYIYETGIVYVVEGAIDCITLAKELPNTVSTLTSKITEEQAFTLSLLAQQMVVVFDSDEAGEYGAREAYTHHSPKFKRVAIKSTPYNDCNSSFLSLGEEDFRDMVKKRIKV